MKGYAFRLNGLFIIKYLNKVYRMPPTNLFVASCLFSFRPRFSTRATILYNQIRKHWAVSKSPFTYSTQKVKKVPIYAAAVNPCTMTVAPNTTIANDLESKLTVDVLDIEELDINLYRGTHLWKPHFSRAIYGGQIIGQALVAAGKTVPNDLNIHSMHSYFVSPGDPNLPIIYHIDCIRDGRSFSSRAVKAVQHGKPILSLQASYHNEPQEQEGPLKFQTSMPSVPHHSQLRTYVELMKAGLEMPNITEGRRSIIIKQLADAVPIECKPVDPATWLRLQRGQEYRSLFWVRAVGCVGADQNLHRCVAAYISDWSLLWTALIKTPEIKPAMMASLDHCMWFHATFQADEWMLYECESSVAGHNRALVHGRIWREDGTLAITISQEGIIRAKL